MEVLAIFSKIPKKLWKKCFQMLASNDMDFKATKSIIWLWCWRKDWTFTLRSRSNTVVGRKNGYLIIELSSIFQKQEVFLFYTDRSLTKRAYDWLDRFESLIGHFLGDHRNVSSKFVFRWLSIYINDYSGLFSEYGSYGKTLVLF